MSNKENIEKLSELRDQALKLIEEYNIIAEKENYETRIGIIDADVDINSIKYNIVYSARPTEEVTDEVLNAIAVDMTEIINGYDHKPYWNTKFPAVTSRFWEPSGINC